MPDVSNWPAGQTGFIGRSTRLVRLRLPAPASFFPRAIQIRTASLSRRLSMFPSPTQRHIYARPFVRPSVRPPVRPSSRNLTLGIFFSLVTSKRAAQRSVASLCSFPSSPRHFFLSLHFSLLPYSLLPLVISSCFSSLASLPFVPSASSGLPEAERFFFFFFVSRLSYSRRLATSRELRLFSFLNGERSQRSRRRLQNMLTSPIFPDSIFQKRNLHVTH